MPYEERVLVIELAERVCALWCAVAVVVTCHVVRDEVHNNLQASLVCTLDQCLELLATLLYVDCKVRVVVIVVLDGIW